MRGMRGIFVFAMNKTLYIRDEDVQVWERARELAGGGLSPVIVSGLKKFITEKEGEEAESKGFERIEVSYFDADEHGIPKRKAFYGKWIYPPDKPLAFSSEDGYSSDNYVVAQTAKQNFVFLTWTEDGEGRGHSHFVVCPSLEAAAADADLNPAVRHAMKKLGVRVEELDI
jgi:hypothetical protein